MSFVGPFYLMQGWQMHTHTVYGEIVNSGAKRQLPTDLALILTRGCSYTTSGLICTGNKKYYSLFMQILYNNPRGLLKVGL